MSATISAYSGNYIPAEASVDCRVKAVTGHRYVVRDLLITAVWDVDIEASSDWNIQTATPPNGSQSTPHSQTTSPTKPSTTSDNNQPQQPEQNQKSDFMSHPLFLLGVGVLVGVVVAMVVLMFFRRHPRPQTSF